MHNPNNHLYLSLAILDGLEDLPENILVHGNRLFGVAVEDQYGHVCRMGYRQGYGQFADRGRVRIPLPWTFGPQML